MIFRAYRGKTRFLLLSILALTATLILVAASAVWPVLAARPAYAAAPNPVYAANLGLQRVIATQPLKSHAEFPVLCPPDKSVIGAGSAIYTPGDLGGAYLQGTALARDTDPALDRPGVFVSGSAMPIPQQGKQTDPNRPDQFLAGYAICAFRKALPSLSVVQKTVENKIGVYNSAQAEVYCPEGTTTMSAYGRVVTDSPLVFLKAIIPDPKGAFAYGVAIPLPPDGSGAQPPQKWSIEVSAVCAPIGSLANLKIIKDSNPRTAKNATAENSITCPYNKALISVGGDVTGGDMRGAFLTDLAPAGLGGREFTMVIGHGVKGYPDDWGVTAHAICMNYTNQHTDD
jgi:hypothetical protein